MIPLHSPPYDREVRLEGFMGHLLEGKWIVDQNGVMRNGDDFVRPDSQYRHIVGEDPFPVAPGRYHLYVSYACPWSHRVLLARALHNLTSEVTVTTVESFMGEDGWVFPYPGDMITGCKYLYELYQTTEPLYSGRVTVPILWDKKRHRIVNNESSDIMRMFNREFGKTRLDLYPEPYRQDIDEINSFIYERLNNGVYKCGFSKAQRQYDMHVAKVFEAMEWCEERLKYNRFLVGDDFTEADVRLFVTLIRFDSIYYSHFKCNMKALRDYPNLLNYTREIFQMKGVAETVKWEEIKQHYYQSHTFLNPTGIIPAGPNLDYAQPHDRDRLARKILREVK